MLSDSEAREQALDPTGSFIIQAPAGSGKTELLIQRYLILLGRANQAPEEIVALTFTRKAAYEMHHRVLQALQQAKLAVPPTSPHSLRTWEIARAALKRAEQLGWNLLSHPNRLRIQTIDSLCASLTRQMPVLSHFGAEPEKTDNPIPLFQEAIREFLTSIESEAPWTDSLAKLLLHVDNNQSKLENLFISMLKLREQWLPYIGSGQIDANKRKQLELVLEKTCQEHLKKLAKQLQKLPVQELIELANFAANQLKASKPDHPICQCDGLTTLPKADITDLPAWLGLAEVLIKQDGEWRKAVNKTQGFPGNDTKLSKRENEQNQVYTKRMKDFLAQISDKHELKKSLHALRGLPPTQYQDQQWEILEALFTVLPVLVAQLHLTFRTHGTVDYSEVALRAQQALGTAENPTDLALSLDYRIQHLLVDEFQDTSITQFQLIEQLTAGWQPEDERTLFLVGDPMQSIYRFRKAEVSLFLRVWEQGLPHIDVQPLKLQANFRSQAGIIEWINQCFAAILPQQADLNIGAVPFSASQAVRKLHTKQAVHIHSLANSDAEAAKIVQLIQASDKAGTIAILVRAKTHLASILPALQNAGIAYRATELESLTQRPIIQDLLALTRALLHLADRIAWLAILRAPWCGLTLADLYALAGSEHELTIWERIVKRHTLAISEDGKQRLEHFANVITQQLQLRQRLPVSLWIEHTWLALGGAACVQQANDFEDAALFFKLLDKLQIGGCIADISALEDELKRLFAMPKVHADDTVEIMTIHKAKGLEFNTVIVPALQSSTKNNDDQLLLWLDKINPDGDIELLLSPIKPKEQKQDALYQYLKQQHKQKDLYEIGRLLYVAATRAKDTLHLSAVIKENERIYSDSFLAQLWPHLQQDFIVNTEVQAQSTLAKQSRTPSLRRIVKPWLLTNTQSSSNNLTTNLTSTSLTTTVDFQTAESLRHMGTLIHRMLYRISLDGLEKWPLERIKSCQDMWRMQLYSAGIANKHIQSCLQRIEQALHNTLSDPKAHWFLNINHNMAESEYALTGLINGQCRQFCIDRTFIDAQGIRWIIDYKTSMPKVRQPLQDFLEQEQACYEQQLGRYAQIMCLCEDNPIRLGLYFPLVSAWHEWDYQT